MASRHTSLYKAAISFIACGLSPLAQAASTDIADIPMAVNNMVKPNVLTIYDNSQSMDAYMGGTLVAGDTATTRGNIGRQVVRDTITNYRTNFNWGLMSYAMSTNPPTKYNTWVYYLGSDTGMVFTDDCNVSGISVSNGSRRCVANPQPFTGGNYVTYDVSSDDSNILDVLYDSGTYSYLWGLTHGIGTSYDIYGSHKTTSGTSWASGAFQTSYGTWSFTPTDAGFLSNNPPYTRQLYLSRAWGYLSNISGSGNLNESVQADSTTHYNNLMSLLASETSSTTSSEIKNGAVFTPLKGTLDASKTYFSSSLGGQSSPITASCQKNFVILVTDGLPTGDTSGNLYSATARTNTFNATTNTWTFGAAAQDAINSVTALRSTAKGATTYDIQTYVVALGDTVNNANALAVMNAMAAAGGGWPTAFLATDSATFQSAFSTVAQDILSKDGSSSAVAVANPNVTGSDNASYASFYNSGTWTGDLVSYPIDITTGQPNINSPIWTTGCSSPTALIDPNDATKGVKGCSAQVQLDLKSISSRKIATYTGNSGTGQGIQFQPTTATTTTKLSTAQQTLLNSTTTPPGPSDGATVVAYLRGDRSQEGTNYRVRAHILGDVVNAEPVIVREPNQSYADTCYSFAVTGTCTTAFKSQQANRTRIVYQGANDGMLHAFNASSGNEEWAYVPNLLMGGLNALSKKTGFTHKYYVDGTPVSGDVDFSNTDGVTGNPNPDWRTILVGGFNKGGRGYYALDVTNPIPADEAGLAQKVLWEFPNSGTSATNKNNVGFSYGMPIIVKTQAKGWVVLVTSGYNNGSDTGGSGHGYLFVLNPTTGAVIAALDTGVGSSTAPSGLAKISAYVENGSIDNTTDFVYGGDLQGNLWRFDLTGNNVNGWNVKKIATLVDGGGTAQPITTAPELAKVSLTGGVTKRFIYVGTGEYLGNTDVSTTQTQSMYGLVDDLSSTPTISPLRSSLQQQTLTLDAGATTRSATSNSVDFTTKKGWYMDMPSSGERINTDPAVALGALIFTSNIPSATACVPGGSSWLNVLDIQTGGKLTGSTVAWSSTSLGNALSSRPVLIKLPSGGVKALVRKSDATTTTVDVPIPGGVTSGRRVSWREIITQ